jgi:peptidoglycan/xylan/chitin deacetylase (PgdA/CDA1 family)
MVISLTRIRRHWARWLAIVLLAIYAPGLVPRTGPPRRRVASPIVAAIPLTHRWVALAFADGAVSAIGPGVLRELSAEGDHATFFVSGDQTMAEGRWLSAAVRLGDDVESHTEGHINLAVHSYVEDYHDLSQASAIIQSLVGYRPHWLLPPYGALGSTGLRAARACHLRVVRPPGPDWIAVAGLSQDQLAARVLRDLTPGAIIVLDDPGDNGQLGRELPRVLSLVALKGYHVGSIAELWRRRH